MEALQVADTIAKGEQNGVTIGGSIVMRLEIGRL
jgi:hypothetical protein